MSCSRALVEQGHWLEPGVGRRGASNQLLRSREAAPDGRIDLVACAVAPNSRSEAAHICREMLLPRRAHTGDRHRPVIPVELSEQRCRGDVAAEEAGRQDDGRVQGAGARLERAVAGLALQPALVQRRKAAGQGGL